MDCKRSAIVRERDRNDILRFAVIVTGSIAADRGNTGGAFVVCSHYLYGGSCTSSAEGGVPEKEVLHFTEGEETIVWT